MLLERGVMKIGMEIEVAKWDDYSYQRVAGDLIEAKYMLGPPEQWSEYHSYHCSCKEGGCRDVRRGHIMIPPLTVMTYDGTLPSTGAEFIISPILLADESQGLAMLQEIWDIVTARAVWSDTGQNIHGGSVSPSIHLHVSATIKPGDGYAIPNNPTYSGDILHALEMFSPELFVLAEASIADKNRRGLKFRWPDRTAMLNDMESGTHHGFVQVREASPDKSVYIEWRLFEAAYHDWRYVESATYLSALLTRALLNKAFIGQLLTAGYAQPYHEAALRGAIDNNNLPALLQVADKTRLDTLRSICLEQIDDDNYGFHLVDDMFSRAEEELETWSN